MTIVDLKKKRKLKVLPDTVIELSEIHHISFAGKQESSGKHLSVHPSRLLILTKFGITLS